MTAWAIYALAFAGFLGAHVLPMLARERLTAALGRRGYLVAYIALSLVLLGVLVAAANAAPRVMLWGPAGWQRWVVNLAMPAAVVLAVFGTAASNPFGTGGSAAGFDPDRPGIAGLTRHPLMWSFALWSGAHLIANGELAHVILFGALAAFALAGIAAAEARARRVPGFARLAAHTGLVPGAALLSGRWRPRGGPAPARLALAVAIWAALYLLHPAVIGMSPAP